MAYIATIPAISTLERQIVVTRCAASTSRLASAKQLEGYLHALIAGVAADHARIRGAR